MTSAGLSRLQVLANERGSARQMITRALLACLVAVSFETAAQQLQGQGGYRGPSTGQPVLTPEQGGTRFHFTLHYRFPGLWRLTPHWLMQLGCHQGLENLRKMIEAKSKKEEMENAHPAELH